MGSSRCRRKLEAREAILVEISDSTMGLASEERMACPSLSNMGYTSINPGHSLRPQHGIVLRQDASTTTLVPIMPSSVACS